MGGGSREENWNSAGRAVASRSRADGFRGAARGNATAARPVVVGRRARSAQRVKSGAAQRSRVRSGGRSAAAVLPVTSRMAARIPFVAAIMALVGCGLALTLVLTTRSAEESYQLSSARAANRTLTEQRAVLQREVASADSAPDLANRARELGMIPAPDPARLVVGPGGAVTVIGKPESAAGKPAPPLNKPPAPDVPKNAERFLPAPVSPPGPPPQPTGRSRNPQLDAAPEGATSDAPAPAAHSGRAVAAPRTEDPAPAPTTPTTVAQPAETEPVLPDAGPPPATGDVGPSVPGDDR